MSTLNIIIVCVILIVVSILLIFLSQSREKARLERMRRITALEDAHSRMLRILDELPPQCLTKELRLLLIDRAIDICGELGSINTRLDVESMLAADQQRRHQIMGEQSADQAPAAIDTAEKATNARALLESLFRFVENRHKIGALDSGRARQYLREILFQVYRVKADYLVFQAREQERRNEPRKAIHFLNLACTEMAKSKDNPAAQRAIAAYRKKIQQLEEIASGGKSTRKVVSATEQKIDREWNDFMEEEEGWKKKADYDD